MTEFTYDPMCAKCQRIEAVDGASIVVMACGIITIVVSTIAWATGFAPFQLALFLIFLGALLRVIFRILYARHNRRHDNG
jgi:membrane protein implicated in regulation of membrane protease activity